MKQVLFGVLIGLMVGVGIGSTLLSPEPRAHEPVVDLPTPTHRPAESPELTGLPPLRAASGRNEAPKLEVGATPAFSNDEIDEAVAATRPVQREHEIGSGVIRGTAHVPRDSFTDLWLKLHVSK